MRHFFTLIFLFLAILVQAQLVITVAGQTEISGSDDGPAFDATFNNPHGIAIDLNGIVYTADRWSHIIRKIDLDGTVSTLAGTPGLTGSTDGVGSAARFFEPWGLCVDNDGNVLVADTRNNKIRKITLDGTVTTVAGSGNYGTSNGNGSASTFGNPTGIETDNQGNIYVADHLTHIIRKIDVFGNVTTLAGSAYQGGDVDGLGTAAKFKRPYGLTLDLDGNILVADEWNHKIRKITPDGVVTTLAGTGDVGSNDGSINSASFNYPWDVTVDSLGNIFVTDGFNYTVRKINELGFVSTYAGTLGTTGGNDGIGTSASFSGATGIALSPLSKELYIGDAYNHLVRKITDLNQGVSLSLTTGNLSNCVGETVEVTSFPNIFDTYHFYIDNSPVQSGSSPIFQTTSLSAGTHSLQVLAENGADSYTSNAISIEMEEGPTPTITTVGSTNFFEGDSVVLVASFGSGYFWSNGETTATITVFDAGNYFVEVTGPNGCTGISNGVEVVVQIVPEAATILVQGDTIICANETTRLVSSESTNNQWLKDGWAIANAIGSEYIVTETGNYQVQVTHSSGVVVISEPRSITVHSDFEVDFVASATSGKTDDVFEFLITQQNISATEWDFGDGNNSTNISPTHQYANEGIYTITLIATNEHGCQDTLTRSDFITIENNPIVNPPIADGSDLFVPTAFTPNEDGENDILYVRGSGIESMIFLIFNQWGEQIFQSVAQSTGWDGTSNNRKVQNGNYVYLLDYVDDKGVRRKLSGNVTVIR